MKKTVALLSTLSAIFLFSCDSSDNNENIIEDLPAPILLQLSEAEIQMTKNGNSSAMNFFSVVNELQNDKENIVLSPLSLNMALAMVWNGANGETKQAIQQTMGLDGYSPEEVNKYFDNLRKTFVKTDPSTQLSLANSIWYRLGFPVKAGFINTNKTWYDAEVREIDFSDSQAPDIINQWCSDNTNGLIKEIVSTISPRTMMYLLNALYFKSQWTDTFGFNSSATTDDPFTKEDGSEVQVKMMQQNNILGYYQDEYLELTALPYGNKAFSMLFILPQPGVSFTDLATRLKQENYWEQCLAVKKAYDVNLYIPRFKIEYEITLNDALKQLGMGIAFDEIADFSDISEVDLCISEVKQKTYIAVDEKGTEAAAVTSIGMVATSFAPEPQPATFRADRPFLFAIQENSTGTILFMGKIGNPE